MAELLALRERQFALGQAMAAAADADAPAAGLPWVCEACMATGNAEARCRVCNAWRSEGDHEKFLAEQRVRHLGEQVAQAKEADRKGSSGEVTVPIHTVTGVRRTNDDEELSTETQPRCVQQRARRDQQPTRPATPVANKQQGKLLYAAIKRNDVNGAKAALSAGATVSQDLCGLSGWTALHLAAKVGHVALCELFVERGADLEARDSFNGLTALHSASSYGHAEVVALLLHQGVDPNLADNDGQTPLMLSSQHGQMESLRLLVAQAGVAKNNLVDRATHAVFQKVPEHDPSSAQEVGTWDTMKRMMLFSPAHADPQTSSPGIDPSTRAVSLNAQNVRGDTALHIAAKKGQVEAFEFLLAVSLDAELRNDAGQTATDIMPPKKLQETVLNGERAAAALAKGNREAVEQLYMAVKQADQSRHQVREAQTALATDERSFAEAVESHEAQIAALSSALSMQQVAFSALEKAKAVSDEAARARDAVARLQEQLQPLSDKTLKQRAEECEGIQTDAVTAACHEEHPHSALVALIMQHAFPSDKAAWDAADNATAEAKRVFEKAEQARQAAATKKQAAQATLRAAESSRNRSERDLKVKQAAEREAVAAAAAALDDGATVSQDLCGLSGWTALHLAAKVGHVALCELFVERGADLEARDSFNGLTALHSASSYGHAEVVALLLRRGADSDAVLLDSDGQTPLMLASAFGHTGACAELLQAGAKLDAADIHGDTSLHIAAKRLQMEVYAALIEAGANAQVRNNDGERPGDIIAAKKLKEAIKQGNHAAAVAALEAGVMPSQKLDSYRRDALHLAAKAGNAGLCELFLEHGADVDARDKFAMTALHSASAYGQKTVVSLLIQRGADSNASDRNGITALMLAAQSGNADTMREILRGGADIDAVDIIMGESALHKSAKMGRKESVRLLLSAGCNSQLKTKENSGRSHNVAKGGKTVGQVLWESTKVKASEKAEIFKLLEHPPTVVPIITLAEERALEATRQAQAAKVARERRAAEEALQRWHRLQHKGLVGPKSLHCYVREVDVQTRGQESENNQLPRGLPPLE